MFSRVCHLGSPGVSSELGEFSPHDSLQNKTAWRETAALRGGRDPAASCGADRTRGEVPEGAGERTRDTTSLEGCTEGDPTGGA